MAENTTRHVHNPGDLVPALVTADAWRYISMALRYRAKVAEGDARRVPEDEDLTRVFTRSAEAYTDLANEVDAMLNRTPSAGRLGTLTPEVAPDTVVGFLLYKHRRADVERDRAELRARGEAARDERHDGERP
jgi:hypothetical protein